MITPSTLTPEPEDGFSSPVALPKSFLPSQEKLLNVESKDSNESKVKSGSKFRNPSLTDLVDSITRRQNGNQPEIKTKVVKQPGSTSTENGNNLDLSTRRRLSISVTKNALIRRQSIDNNNGLPEVVVTKSRRGSIVPSLADVGERFRIKAEESKVEEGKKENKVNEVVKENQVDEVDDTATGVNTSGSLIPVEALPLVPTTDSNDSKSSQTTISLSTIDTSCDQTSTTTTNEGTSKEEAKVVEKKLTSTHPLQNKWTFYFSSGQSATESPEPKLKTIGEVATLEQFGPFFNHLRRPSQLSSTNASIFLFKTGILPDIEDEKNQNGGKWQLKIKGDNEGSLIDKCWIYTVLSLVGESLDEEDQICGAAIRSNSLVIWIKDSSLISINAIGTRLLKVLELNGSSKMEHQIQFDYIPHNSTSTTTSTGEKKISPFISINTFNKVSTIASGSSIGGWRSRSTTSKGGIVGGVLGF